MKRGRRGQITIFIIIGIVILLTVGTVIYFTQRQAVAPVRRVVVPEDVQSVYDYVATCLEQIGKDGLIIMGAQGGVINVPPIIANTPDAYVANDPMGISKTPMWYYEGQDRTPQLDQMQGELSAYVKTNLPGCVDFTVFEPQFKVTPKSGILPIITFTEDDVILQVNWELEVQTPERIVTIPEYIVDFPVKLKPLWQLANKIMTEENRQGWFEGLTIDLMSINPRIPLSGMEFSCGTKKWNLQTVKEELRNTLYYNLPYIRIENTQYPPALESVRVYNNLRDDAEDIREDLTEGKEPDWPENVPDDVFEMNRMRWDVGQRTTDLKVSFVYQKEWPLRVNVQPSQGGILSTAQAKGARKYLRFLCMNQWHFAYDVIYPVKGIIRDDDAFRGEGFNFQFAFPAIIEDNEQNRKYFGLRRFVAPDTGGEFCTNFGTQLVDVRALGFVEGSPVAEELEDANITYRCLSEECKLGSTYSDESGIIRVQTYLPEGCSNPLIIAEKEGYLAGQEYATQELVEVLMTKLQKMDYSIVVHPYYEEADTIDPTKSKNQRWLEEQTYRDFTKIMHATVTISLRDQPFEQFKTYPPSGEAYAAQGNYDTSLLAGVENTEVGFVYGDANYDIDIMLFKGDTPIGGYHAENLTISYEEIAGSTEVEFHVIEYRPLPDQPHKQAGMFLFLYERGKYLDGTPYWEALRPTFT